MSDATNTELDEVEVELEGQETEAPEQETGSPEQGASGEEELASYSKGVQERIRKLTAKYRQEERDKAEALRLAEELRNQNQQLQQRLQGLDQGYLSEYGARLDAQAQQAKQVYREAYESGDTDKMFEAQQLLNRITIEQERHRLAKARADQAKTATETPAPQRAPASPAPAPAPQVEPDPKAKSWAEKNTWFGQDETMTYAAFGIHRRLVEEEGFDPASDEYYTEVDRRIRAEFPHKFQRPKPTGNGTPVAPGSSSASRSQKQGRRSVKLSPSQVAIAKKLGVPLEEYAKYVKE